MSTYDNGPGLNEFPGSCEATANSGCRFAMQSNKTRKVSCPNPISPAASSPPRTTCRMVPSREASLPDTAATRLPLRERPRRPAGTPTSALRVPLSVLPTTTPSALRMVTALRQAQGAAAATAMIGLRMAIVLSVPSALRMVTGRSVLSAPPMVTGRSAASVLLMVTVLSAAVIVLRMVIALRQAQGAAAVTAMTVLRMAIVLSAAMTVLLMATVLSVPSALRMVTALRQAQGAAAVTAVTGLLMVTVLSAASALRMVIALRQAQGAAAVTAMTGPFAATTADRICTRSARTALRWATLPSTTLCWSASRRRPQRLSR
jgi:hypothetical protein